MVELVQSRSLDCPLLKLRAVIPMVDWILKREEEDHAFLIACLPHVAGWISPHIDRQLDAKTAKAVLLCTSHAMNAADGRIVPLFADLVDASRPYQHNRAFDPERSWRSNLSAWLKEAKGAPSQASMCSGNPWKSFFRHRRVWTAEKRCRPHRGPRQHFM